MNSNMTDLTIVLDRSGSMQACRDDAEVGLNAFVEKQKQRPGDCWFTLVQFDTEYEFVHKATRIQDVPPHKLQPRGATALLDAVGRAIVETGERLKAMAEADRPGLVAMVVITDGHENSSRDYTKTKIKEMIEHQTNVYKWQFTFLGANQDAFAEAGAMGFARGAVADYSVTKTVGMYEALEKKMGRMRQAARLLEPIDNDFLEEEREEMKEKK